MILRRRFYASRVGMHTTLVATVNHQVSLRSHVPTGHSSSKGINSAWECIPLCHSEPRLVFMGRRVRNLVFGLR